MVFKSTETLPQRTPSSNAPRFSTPPPTPEPTGPVLDLLSLRCTEDSIGNAIATGEVRNISTERLGAVKVTASFRTESGDLLEQEHSYLSIKPLLPGQSSGFKVYGPKNPLYKACEVNAFTEGWATRLSFRNSIK